MISKLKIIVYLLITIFIFYCTYLSAFLVLQGELELTNDIGRDFLLLQELDQKKIVFIGARSNTQGIFHGVFWTYLNYPAYLLGHGNPVTVGLFWVFLGIILLITTFLMFRKLFNTLTALLAVALLAVDLIPQTNRVFGQIAGFYFMPFFLFSMYMYIKDKKIYFLIFHFITVGIFIQLNIGVGGLFTVLSIMLSSIIIVKNKLWTHFLSFMFLPITLLNYILFEIRHDFNITKALFHLGTATQFILPFNDWIQNRISIVVSMCLSPSNPYNIRFIIFILISIFTVLEIIKNSKQKIFFLLMIFYFYGYMILTYFTKGVLLEEFVTLLIPLSVLWLSAFIKGSYKIIFIPAILILIYINFTYAEGYLSWKQNNFMGKSPDSWLSLKAVAQNIIDEQKGKEFGYYVYSPDSYAYQQRYALIYAFSNAKAINFEYVKKPITYVVVTPPPVLIPYMREDWWIQNQVKISSLPVSIKKFPSGYLVEKFNLTTDEQTIPHDPNIELKLHFR